MTHDMPLLREMDPQWELGIHPNFNFLLDGDGRNGSKAVEVIQRVVDLVPSPRSVRSHSITQSAVLFNQFQAFGLTHDVNVFVPSGAGLSLRPWMLWNGMVRVPYLWEGDAHCVYQTTAQREIEPAVLAAAGAGLTVFDFHPIHVFLNTESLDRYDRTRPLHRDPAALIEHRYEGYGTRNRLIDLLALVRT